MAVLDSLKINDPLLFLLILMSHQEKIEEKSASANQDPADVGSVAKDHSEVETFF